MIYRKCVIPIVTRFMFVCLYTGVIQYWQYRARCQLGIAVGMNYRTLTDIFPNKKNRAFQKGLLRLHKAILKNIFRCLTTIKLKTVSTKQMLSKCCIRLLLKIVFFCVKVSFLILLVTVPYRLRKDRPSPIASTCHFLKVLNMQTRKQFFVVLICKQENNR